MSKHKLQTWTPAPWAVKLFADPRARRFVDYDDAPIRPRPAPAPIRDRQRAELIKLRVWFNALPSA